MYKAKTVRKNSYMRLSEIKFLLGTQNSVILSYFDSLSPLDGKKI